MSQRQSYSEAGRIKLIKKKNSELMGNGNLDLPPCGIMP
jgi:hypothetical protein